MSDRHLQTKETKAKIGQSTRASSWRRKAKDKPNDMVCAVGAWEEDYQSPSIQWRGRAILWEEYNHALDYDR